MLIKLIVGDWSHDGHELTEDVIFEVNVDKITSLIHAFETGEKVLGIRWDQVCDEYLVSYVPDDVIQKLAERSIDVHRSHDIQPKEFARVWMEIAKIGWHGLEYSLANIPTETIGGYGLFNAYV